MQYARKKERKIERSKQTNKQNELLCRPCVICLSNAPLSRVHVCWVFTSVLHRCCGCCCFGLLVNNERTQHRGSKHCVSQPQAEREREAVVSHPPSLSNTCFSHPFSALVYRLVHIFDNSCSTFPNIYLFFL